MNLNNNESTSIDYEIKEQTFRLTRTTANLFILNKGLKQEKDKNFGKEHAAIFGSKNSAT